MVEAKRLIANSGRYLAISRGAREIRLLARCGSQHLTSMVMNEDRTGTAGTKEVW